MEENTDNVASQLSTILKELSSLKQQVQGTNANVAQEVQKLKTEKEVKWRFEGNKIQHTFNTEILDILRQGIWGLENRKADYALEQFNSVEERLVRRNKLIRIADTSTGGWETVTQYELNPVADNSDDENKILKAEARALKKKKSNRGRGGASASGSTAGVNWGGQAAGFNYNSSNRGKSFRGARSFPYGYGQGNHGYGNSNVNKFAGPNGGGFGPAPGPCYTCGEMSHFRRDCPYQRSGGLTGNFTGSRK